MNNNNRDTDSSANGQSNNEIDLIDIFRYLGNGIRSFFVGLWSVLIHVLVYLVRNALWLALFVGVGITLGTIHYKRADSVYTSELVVRLNGQKGSIEFASEVERINKLIKHNPAEAATKLAVPEAQLHGVVALDVYYGISGSKPVVNANNAANKQQNSMQVLNAYSDYPIKYIPSTSVSDALLDSVSKCKYLKIKAIVKTEDVYTHLRDGIINLASNSSFDTLANTVRKNELREIIKNVTLQLQHQEALQQLAVTQPTATYKTKEEAERVSGSYLLQIQQNIIQLQESKIALERELALYATPITIVSDFNKTYAPSNQLAKTYLVPYILLFFFIGLLVTLMITYRKALWRTFFSSAK